MRVHNKSKNNFQHSFLNEKNELVVINLEAGQIAEVDDEIAKIWLKTGKVVEFVEPAAAKEEKEELLAEIEKLKAENKKLKAEKPKAAKTAKK